MNVYVVDEKRRVCIEEGEGVEWIRDVVKMGEKLGL